MFPLDADIFLADLGDPVTWTPTAGGAAKAGLMIFDQQVESIEGGEKLSRQYKVTLAVADWPGLKRAEVLTIGGTGGGGRFKLRTDLQYELDGVFASVSVTRVD